MPDTELQERVREEVEDLHRFFVGWFSGAVAEGEFERRFLARIAPDVVFIPPRGAVLAFDGLAAAIRDGYGNNPSFRIAIRNVTVRRVVGDHVLATYEELQRNALATTPADNARIATVLFRDGAALQWLHIHETRFEAPADAYDF